MTDDALITFTEFGGMLAGASAKTAQRRAHEAGLAVFRIGGRTLLRMSDVRAYLDGQRIEPTVPETNLKTLVHAAVERAKRRRA